MRTKLLALAVNPTVGVTETERKIAGDHLGGKVDKNLVGDRVFINDRTVPIYLRIRIGYNIISTTLLSLCDLRNPVVIEFEPRNPHMSDLLYEKEIFAAFREILSAIRYGKRPYILILGLPLEDCRQYIDAAYTVEPITDLTGHLTDYYSKISSSMKCIHQKALIR